MGLRSHILQMWYTQYALSNSSAAVDVMKGILGVIDRGCDVSCIVYMLPYILDVVSYIEAVMS